MLPTVAVITRSKYKCKPYHITIWASSTQSDSFYTSVKAWDLLIAFLLSHQINWIWVSVFSTSTTTLFQIKHTACLYYYSPCPRVWQHSLGPFVCFSLFSLTCITLVSKWLPNYGPLLTPPCRPPSRFDLSPNDECNTKCLSCTVLQSLTLYLTIPCLLH